MEIIPDQKPLPLLVAKLRQILFRGLSFFFCPARSDFYLFSDSTLWRRTLGPCFNPNCTQRTSHLHGPNKTLLPLSLARPSTAGEWNLVVAHGGQQSLLLSADFCQLQGHLGIWNIIVWNTIHERENCFGRAKTLWLRRVKMRRTNLIHSKVCKDRAWVAKADTIPPILKEAPAICISWRPG